MVLNKCGYYYVLFSEVSSTEISTGTGTLVR